MDGAGSVVADGPRSGIHGFGWPVDPFGGGRVAANRSYPELAKAPRANGALGNPFGLQEVRAIARNARQAGI